LITPGGEGFARIFAKAVEDGGPRKSTSVGDVHRSASIAIIALPISSGI
jgi:hypothetical protein